MNDNTAIDGLVQHPKPSQPVNEHRRKLLAELTEELSQRVRDELLSPVHDLAFEMRLRSLFCESQAIFAASSLADEDRATVQRLSEDIAIFCSPGQGEFPFAYSSPSVKMWNSVGDGYERCAIASEALLWYRDNVDDIALSDRDRLLNAVAASQQSLFRLEDTLGVQDWHLNELYTLIRAQHNSAGWLSGLDQHTSDGELLRLADECAKICDDVAASVEEAQSGAERQEQQDAAVQAVVDWEEALEGRTVTATTEDADRETLFEFLNECIAAGVPPTNRRVRSALLDTASVLLVGHPKYAKFLEAVLAERARIGLDAVEVVQETAPELVDDGDFEQMREKVAQFTRGKKLLMMGGKTRPRVCDELSDALKCEVTWPDSEVQYKGSKFDVIIRNADIVLLLKNYASHDMFYRAKDLVGEHGGHFIVLPAGYGVRQVVSQIAEYVERAGAH